MYIHGVVYLYLLYIYIRGDADWVIIFHTNPGCMGKRDEIGDIDFIFNSLILPLQPGSYSVSSSHSRAWIYYAESVYPGQENIFLAKECTSITALNKGYCIGPWIPVGYATPKNTKGNYFLKTNSKSPYGQNSTLNFKPVCVN